MSNADRIRILKANVVLYARRWAQGNATPEEVLEAVKALNEALSAHHGPLHIDEAERMRLAILRTPAGQAVARVNVAEDKCAYECAVAHGGEIYWYAGTDHGEPVFVSGSEFAPRGDS